MAIIKKFRITTFKKEIPKISVKNISFSFNKRQILDDISFVVREGEIIIRRMMNLTASFDHRIIDGYDGALLIQELKSILEYPATIFM